MMKLFAIRDRMLDYFQAPVAVTREQDFFQAVSRNVNGEGNELAQAPDHYEIWQVAEIDDQGHITAKREFIGNCSRYIRNGVWQRRAEGAAGTEGATSTLPRGPGRIGEGPGARPGSTESETGPAPVAPQEPPKDAGRSDPRIVERTSNNYQKGLSD